MTRVTTDPRPAGEGLAPALGQHRQQQAGDGAGGGGVPGGVPLSPVRLERFRHAHARRQGRESLHLRVAVEEADHSRQHQHQAEIAHQSPRKTGFLFSRKAVVPSILSAESKVIAWAVDSNTRPADSGIWLEAFKAAFASRTASGPRARTCSAIARAAAMSSGPGTTRLTRPNSSARAASHRAPVRIISLARPRPTMRGRRWVPPAPGMIPSVGSGRPNTAVLAAIRRSQARATSHPPPSA